MMKSLVCPNRHYPFQEQSSWKTSSSCKEDKEQLPRSEARISPKKKQVIELLFCIGRDALKCSSDTIDVQILLHQEELTLNEYIINDRKIKVL